jgi:hypothetical protein
MFRKADMDTKRLIGRMEEEYIPKRKEDITKGHELSCFVQYCLKAILTENEKDA